MSVERPDWNELYKHEGKRSTLYLYENTRTGEVDLVQVNDDGESITSRLDPSSVTSMIKALNA